MQESMATAGLLSIFIAQTITKHPLCTDSFVDQYMVCLPVFALIKGIKENTMIAHHMFENRGLKFNRGSMIVGSSVHNQRIERLWRDLHRCVTQLYYRLFFFLEYQGLLNPVNEYHLFALHYVFMPRLNKSLDGFVQS